MASDVIEVLQTTQVIEIISGGAPGPAGDSGGGGGVTDHGALTGLADDDHSQYHTDARGDARYYTQAQVTAALGGKADTGHTHDDRYYTDTEVDLALAAKADSVHTHTVSQLSDATANGRSLIAAADYAAMRSLLSLVPGANVQAFDATLAALAAWDWSSGTEVPTFTADDTLSVLRVGTGANNLVQLDGTSKLPAVDGSALTNIPAGTVSDGSITNAKLANVATATIKGRTTAGPGVPEDLSASQARTVLGLGTAALSATTDFAPAAIRAALSADHTWTGTPSVMQTISGLTLTLPSAGMYHIHYFSIGYAAGASHAYTTRIAEGTCVINHANSESVGVRMGANSTGTVAQVLVTTGTPSVCGAAAINTNSYSVQYYGVTLDVTTPGTLLFQAMFNVSGDKILAGAYSEALKLS